MEEQYKEFDLTDDDFILTLTNEAKARLWARELKMCFTCRRILPLDDFRPGLLNKSAADVAKGGDCMACEDSLYQKYLNRDDIDRVDLHIIEGTVRGLRCAYPIRKALAERGLGYCHKCDTILTLDAFPKGKVTCKACNPKKEKKMVVDAVNETVDRDQLTFGI